MCPLFICLMMMVVCIAAKVSAASECEINTPIKDVQYFRQIWLEGLIKSYKWTRKTRNEQFKPCISDTPKVFGTFDFVIIGGGNAGSVLANRLSENMQWKVLLLEPGGEEGDLTLMPGALPILVNSDQNWGHLTRPQKYACFGMKKKQCALNRGKHLGGDTMISSEAYMRASTADFKRWAQISSKWSYDECLYYYKKAENMSISSRQSDFHGTKGPQIIGYPQRGSAMVDYIIEANKELGHREVDYNSPNQLGVSHMQVTVNKGIKQSANQAYLKPIREFRKNLIILTKALPSKIIFMHDSIATGLNFMHEGQVYNVSIKKEILLCAGGYNTPQLLMLSGIGPKDHLAEHNIPLIADLPVGKNLINRQHIDIRFKTNLSVECSNLERDVYRYINGRGSLATPISRAITFGKFPSSKATDYMIVYNIPYTYTDSSLFKSMYNYDDVMDGMLRDRKSNDIIARVTYLHPKARGRVKLHSDNPVDYVDINPDYLSDMNDLDYIYKTIESTLKLLNTHTFKTIGASLGGYFIPACDKFTDLIYWHCIASYVMDSIGDPMGTCKMGRGKDSVVDQNLIIHGFVNVRVVDASAIPISISAHSRTTELMMGEKIADAIRIKYLMRTINNLF